MLPIAVLPKQGSRATYNRRDFGDGAKSCLCLWRLQNCVPIKIVVCQSSTTICLEQFRAETIPLARKPCCGCEAMCESNVEIFPLDLPSTPVPPECHHDGMEKQSGSMQQGCFHQYLLPKLALRFSVASLPCKSKVLVVCLCVCVCVCAR